MNKQNPLLNPPPLKDKATPYNLIKNEHFLPALTEALRLAQDNLKKIVDNPTPATFENTLLALETSSEKLDSVSAIYFNLFSAHGDEDLRGLAPEISAKLASYSNDVTLNAKLFKRIESVHSQLSSLGLTNEQEQMVTKAYRDFCRNGAQLSDEGKKELRRIDQELSSLGPQFSENILNATNEFELYLEEKDLVGLPESTREAAALEAKEKGKDGQWLITLQIPSFMPFMQYSDRRDLRETLYKAYNSRGLKAPHDNRALLKSVVRLRKERAKLLGFESHAHFVLQERMAETPDRVNDFLNRLFIPSKSGAQRDLAEIRELAKAEGGPAELKPWDFAYYSEKLKQKKYAFNEEDLRPFFKLENVVEGVFEHARRLYNLKFTETKDVPAYHPDVRVYEVNDEKTGEYIGLFYTDFFPRSTKKSGAWMTSGRDQGLFEGSVLRPHIMIVCNLTKPTETKPSLLSYDEVRTLFHEFGHALHGLLSKCTYRSLSGTNVYWDFVELPSQIMENWVTEEEGLQIFSRHYKTGAPLSAELAQKIKKASRFLAGYYSLRQLSLGYLDMAWHSQDLSEIEDVIAFERKATETTTVFDPVDGVAVSPSFSHIFAGGYSSGYYSYKWAEALDADAFELFKQKGLFNQEVAQAFKDNILARGGTEHPMTLYKKFRGREPDTDALLRRDGLI